MKSTYASFLVPFELCVRINDDEKFYVEIDLSEHPDSYEHIQSFAFADIEFRGPGYTNQNSDEAKACRAAAIAQLEAWIAKLKDCEI
jgi:hypothetical protein